MLAAPSALRSVRAPGARHGGLGIPWLPAGCPVRVCHCCCCARSVRGPWSEHDSSGGSSPMVFVFGECTLDVDRRELRRAGIVCPLEPKAFLVLMHLLTQCHRAVSKDELLATCWPNEFVTEAALTRCLRVIRQAVADDGVQQHCIKTLRGYGYRFVADVEERATREPDNPSPQVESP